MNIVFLTILSIFLVVASIITGAAVIFPSHSILVAIFMGAIWGSIFIPSYKGAWKKWKKVFTEKQPTHTPLPQEPNIESKPKWKSDDLEKCPSCNGYTWQSNAICEKCGFIKYGKT